MFARSTWDCGGPHWSLVSKTNSEFCCHLEYMRYVGRSVTPEEWLERRVTQGQRLLEKAERMIAANQKPFVFDEDQWPIGYPEYAMNQRQSFIRQIEDFWASEEEERAWLVRPNIVAEKPMA